MPKLDFDVTVVEHVCTAQKPSANVRGPRNHGIVDCGIHTRCQSCCRHATRCGRYRLAVQQSCQQRRETASQHEAVLPPASRSNTHCAGCTTSRRRVCRRLHSSRVCVLVVSERAPAASSRLNVGGLHTRAIKSGGSSHAVKRRTFTFTVKYTRSL